MHSILQYYGLLQQIFTGVNQIESLEYSMCITKVYDYTYTGVYPSICMVLLVTQFTVGGSTVNAYTQYSYNNIHQFVQYINTKITTQNSGQKLYCAAINYVCAIIPICRMRTYMQQLSLAPNYSHFRGSTILILYAHV